MFKIKSALNFQTSMNRKCILQDKKLELGCTLTQIHLCKGACQKHPEGGGPHFLGGVQTIFTLFRGGTDQFQHF